MAVDGNLNKIKVFNNIVKPDVDQCRYRGLELENGMKILLVSDPKTDKSAASVDIHIGSLSDPIPGLAHFCEHMLFLGSKKYPGENTYAKFVQDNGGFSNAFTSSENTNYHFDISNNNLIEALDIFSQFFIAPLFDPDSTDREINAVNSEHNKNLKSDGWRLFQMTKSFCKPTHPFSKFGTGNTETLKIEPEKQGIQIRDELIKFHSEHYSSNIMTACILGVDSLDVLQEHAINLFRAVPNKSLSKRNFDSNPIMEETLKHIHYFVPIEESHELHLTFQIPDYRGYYKSSPVRYVSHLIGHEGKGSLLSYLKQKCWCNSLYTSHNSGARGFDFFDVMFELTEEGIDHIMEIIELFYQYVNLLRKEGIQKWIFDEIVEIGKMEFRYKDKDVPANYVCDLSGNLQRLSFDDVLCAGFYASEYQPELEEKILELLKPELMVAIAVSKKYEGTTDKVEKWYGSEYRSDSISDDKLSKWNNCGFNDAFKLPKPNNFIPNDFSLVTHPNNVSKVPEVLKKTSLMRVWYKGDDKFLLPKASLKLELRNPLSYLNPRNYNMTKIFIDLVHDSLIEYVYPAELAGLSYGIYNTYYGIELNIGGYNDKLEMLIEKVVKRLTTFKVDEKRFNVIKEKYKRNLHNFETDIPVSHAQHFMYSLLREKEWSNEELLETVDSFTVKNLQEYIPQLLTNGVFIESIMFGNISKQKTLDIFESVESYLKNAALVNSSALVPLMSSQNINFRHVKLLDGCDLVYHYNNKIHETVGIENYYQCEIEDTKNNVLTELFTQIVKEDAFNVLRTQEQLGYIVDCSVRRSCGMQGIEFIIQSDKPPTVLDERIENFISITGEKLSKLTSNEFDKHVESLRVIKLEEPKTIWMQCSFYWAEIYTHLYNFDRVHVECEFLKSVTKADIIEFYEKYISSLSPNRKKLSVYVNPIDMNSEVIEKIKDKKIEDISDFKSYLPLCPLPKPYNNI